MLSKEIVFETSFDAKKKVMSLILENKSKQVKEEHEKPKPSNILCSVLFYDDEE
jgi:hypothetical protein